jgi:molybdate transport system ATP-binding protein
MPHSYSFTDIQAELHKKQCLTVPALTMKNGEYWAIIGGNGSGKSALACLFNSTLSVQHGSIEGLAGRTIHVVSFEEQKALIEREKERDDGSILDVIWEGTLVSEMFSEVSDDTHTINKWVTLFNLGQVLNKGFRKLSTGETRKVILIRALLTNCDLLVLDEPFDGLDASSQQHLKTLLDQLHNSGQNMLLILNRLDEVPKWVSHLGFIHNLTLELQGLRDEILQHKTVQALLHFSHQTFTLPKKDASAPHLTLSSEQPLVKLNNGRVAYTDRLIFDNLNWTIGQGEHWVIQGPNGCGKSTLLNLISGDHPQCYANDLTVFGIKRGSGESIWDIKQHIGIISASLQWQYKGTVNVLSTVVSGLFDTIGLYSKVGDLQKALALDWLAQVGLEHKANLPLQQLSFGEQRLVLICRAMIKQPALLILDEPCQGLDETNRHLVLGFIELLAQQQNTSLLYVTHHVADILPCFDKRLVCVNVSEALGSEWQVQL